MANPAARDVDISVLKRRASALRFNVRSQGVTRLATANSGQIKRAKSRKVASKETQSPATAAPQTAPLPARKPPARIPAPLSRSTVIASAASARPARSDQSNRSVPVDIVAQTNAQERKQCLGR